MYTSDAVYRCRDIWQTAALLTLGLSLIKVEFQPRRRGERPGAPWAVFHLQDRPERPRWVEEYAEGTLSLPVAELRAKYHLLRDVLRSAAAGTGRKGA